MQILLAVDKFKDSLTATEVINSISDGILKVDANVKIDSLVLSDGGDGFLEAVQSNISKLQQYKVNTVNALGHPITAHYGYEFHSNTAYVELALSSGIAQLSQSERNALITSTFGTGLVLKEAISKGAKTIYVGLGGSGTNDGGCGIAAALGYTFLNKVGEGFIPTAHNFGNIVEIIPPANSIDCQIYAVNDVKNPLLGKNGATYTYGPQKGVRKEDLARIEGGMRHLAQKVKSDLGVNAAEIPGAGAAGGTAFGLKAFLDADFISGIDFILGLNSEGEARAFADADLIVTGEGKIDEQTLQGKLVNGIVKKGLENNVPVIAFCGKLDVEANRLGDVGLMEIVEIGERDKPLEYNLKNAGKLLEQKSFEFFKNWLKDN